MCMVNSFLHNFINIKKKIIKNINIKYYSQRQSSQQLYFSQTPHFQVLFLFICLQKNGLSSIKLGQ